MFGAGCLITCLQSPMNFTGADCIDEHSMFPCEVENGDIRARLLGEADDVELLQIVDSLDNFGSVIDVQRRSETLRELTDCSAGNFRAGRVKRLRNRHVGYVVRLWSSRGIDDRGQFL